MEAAVALGAYGRPTQARVASDIVASLARAAMRRRSGVVQLNDLFNLPVSLVMLAGALGAVATQNARMLSAFIVNPETATNYGDQAPVHQLNSAWDPYAQDLRIADLYAKTLSGLDVDPDDYDRPSQGGGEYYMAPQVVLTQLLKPLLSDFTIDNDGYRDLYSRMEVLAGAAVFDDCGPHSRNLRYPLATNWVGRHIVDERHSRTRVADSVLGELDSQGPRWWPIVDGAMFGGDVERAREALMAYAQAASDSRTNLRH